MLPAHSPAKSHQKKFALTPSSSQEFQAPPTSETSS
jgi:hypothetical protein